MNKSNKFCLVFIFAVSVSEACFWKLFKHKDEHEPVEAPAIPPYLCQPALVQHYTDGTLDECGEFCPKGVIRSVKRDGGGNLVLCGRQNSGDRPTTTSTPSTAAEYNLSRDKIMKLFREFAKKSEELTALKEETVQEKRYNAKDGEIDVKKPHSEDVQGSVLKEKAGEEVAEVLEVQENYDQQIPKEQ